MRRYLFDFLLTLIFTSALVMGGLGIKHFIDGSRETTREGQDPLHISVLKFEKTESPFMGVVDDVSGTIKQVGFDFPKTSKLDTVSFFVYKTATATNSGKFQLIGIITVTTLGETLWVLRKEKTLKNNRILLFSPNSPIGTRFFIFVRPERGL